MLVTDRDCQTGGARFAVPTLGEIEGKLLVSEVVDNDMRKNKDLKRDERI
ncbi:hypothetical protein [Rhizobium ruizarguesonis]|nr:hypothetical protein [Rhizobium ruizarguesonis]